MPVVYEKRDHIGIVTLSRPTARNAWGADFNEGLERHFDVMEEDDDIRCAILTGDESGGAFSAGANLKDPQTHTMGSAAELIKSIPRRKHRAFEVLGNFPKPLIGAVNGSAGMCRTLGAWGHVGAPMSRRDQDGIPRPRPRDAVQAHARAGAGYLSRLP